MVFGWPYEVKNLNWVYFSVGNMRCELELDMLFDWAYEVIMELGMFLGWEYGMNLRLAIFLSVIQGFMRS